MYHKTLSSLKNKYIDLISTAILINMLLFINLDIKFYNISGKYL